MSDNPQTEFYTIANKARSIGLLSQAEIDLLCQKGTRKHDYWGRHLRNLKEYIVEKIRKIPDGGKSLNRLKEIDELLAMC